MFWIVKDKFYSYKEICKKQFIQFQFTFFDISMKKQYINYSFSINIFIIQILFIRFYINLHFKVIQKFIIIKWTLNRVTKQVYVVITNRRAIAACSKNAISPMVNNNSVTSKTHSQPSCLQFADQFQYSKLNCVE